VPEGRTATEPQLDLSECDEQPSVAQTVPALPAALTHTDEHDAALASILTYDGRMAYHVRALRSIARWDGLNGAQAYQARFPEAVGVYVANQPTAARALPKGTDDALCGMVDGWFNSAAALAATNRDCCSRLNERLETTRFDPDRYFGRQLSAHKLAKLKETFARNGAYLDTSKFRTMGQVREAVKAAKASANPRAKPFGNVGMIDGKALTLGSKSFRIEDHKGREGIRLTVHGRSQRIALDTLEVVLAGITPSLV
jgi:hypothetical protein